MRNLAAAMLVVLLGPVAVTGCDSGGRDEDGSDPRIVEVRGERMQFTVEVPPDWGITEIVDDSGCGTVAYDLGELEIEAVPTSCTEAADNAAIGNGFHGHYRTLDDVEAPTDESPVESGLGSGTVFTQEYYECTNSCSYWDEPVAIVTLDEPVDPNYPTLVVRGRDGDTFSPTELTAIVETLNQPDVAISPTPTAR